MTSLKASAMFGHYEVVKTLLAADAPISDRELLPQTVDWKSASIEIVNHILREGRPPRDVLDASLRFACNRGNPDIIRALVAAGADVNAIDSVRILCSSCDLECQSQSEACVVSQGARRSQRRSPAASWDTALRRRWGLVQDESSRYMTFRLASIDRGDVRLRRTGPTHHA